METADRIRLVRRRTGMSQSKLATAVSVARSAVAQWERRGGPRPTNEHMAQIAICCNVSYEWLVTGRGTIGVDADDDAALAVDIELHLYAQDELEKRLLSAFREIRYPGNQGLVELIETLMQKNARARQASKLVSLFGT